MSNRFKSIKLALDGKMNQLLGETPIAWEGTNYKPTYGNKYLRPTLLISGGEVSIMDRTTEFNGVYQVDVFVKNNQGSKELYEQLDAIYDLFSEESELSYGDVTLFIRTINMNTPVQDDAWLIGTLDIEWQSFTQ